jgi:hypothetical protein
MVSPWTTAMGRVPRGETEMNAQTIEAADLFPVDQDIAGYEAPELVKVDSAKALLRGLTYAESYYDCDYVSTTRYIFSC